VNVTGDQRDDYAVTLWAEATGETEEHAEAQLASMDVTKERGRFVLACPDGSNPGSCFLYWDILAPGDRPVVIHADHAAVDVFGMRASVTISSSHGRVSVLESSGATDVAVSDGGWVIWAGRGGDVRLHADLGIDLKLTAATFEGRLAATAVGSVRVLLPRSLR